MRFEPATLRTQGTEPTTEPPRPTIKPNRRPSTKTKSKASRFYMATSLFVRSTLVSPCFAAGHFPLLRSALSLVLFRIQRRTSSYLTEGYYTQPRLFSRYVTPLPSVAKIKSNWWKTVPIKCWECFSLPGRRN